MKERKMLEREPTREMLDAAAVNNKPHPTAPHGWDSAYGATWRRMWDAAPADRGEDEYRIDQLAEMLKACPHAVITWNDDADRDDDDGIVPLGYSVRIDGCVPLCVSAPTLRECLDLANLPRTEDDEARPSVSQAGRDYDLTVAQPERNEDGKSASGNQGLPRTERDGNRGDERGEAERCGTRGVGGEAPGEQGTGSALGEHRRHGPADGPDGAHAVNRAADVLLASQAGPQQKAVGTQAGQTDIVELIARLESHKCHISDEEYGWDFDAGRLAIKALRCLMDGTPSSQEDHAAGLASPAAPPKADHCEWCAPEFGCWSGGEPCRKPGMLAPPQSREGETDTLRRTDDEKPPFIRLGNAYFLCEQLELRLSATLSILNDTSRAHEDRVYLAREALSSPGGGEK